MLLLLTQPNASIILICANTFFKTDSIYARSFNEAFNNGRVDLHKTANNCFIWFCFDLQIKPTYVLH